MLFDNTILHLGMDFAAQLYAKHRQLSSIDFKDIILGCFSGIPIAEKAQCEQIRKMTPMPSQKGACPILVLITALSEMDRLTGWRYLLPVELIDLISHLLPSSEEAPVVCHGSRTLQLAIWFASCGRNVHFLGDNALIPHITAITGKKVTALHPSQPFPQGAGHIAMCDSGDRDSELGTFLRHMDRSNYQGAIVLTSWSFLSSTSPRTLQLKQKLIENNSLYSSIQLPDGIIPRTLPALLQLGPSKPNILTRLVDAKDWSVPSRQGIEISYLAPILALAYQSSPYKLPRWAPKPPTESVDGATLLQRGCDLRLKTSPFARKGLLSFREEPLGGCAALIRGQMLNKSKEGEQSNVFQEVTLADIDESGFITDASRIIPEAAPLMHLRKVACLKKDDLLLVCKGSLQSLGKVGLVTHCGDAWFPSQTFYLVRGECIDPIWLFHYLRSARALNYLRSHISGTSIPQIRVADIAALPVPIPDEISLAAVHAIHQKALHMHQRIGKLRVELGKILESPFASIELAP